MTPATLGTLYRGYIACLNARDWDNLGTFVDREVVHNARPLGLAGYRAMLEQNVREVPDLAFEIERLVTEPPDIAARLKFNCTPIEEFFGLPVDGRRIVFCENVFYRFRDSRIVRVWSIVDKAAIEAQL